MPPTTAETAYAVHTCWTEVGRATTTRTRHGYTARLRVAPHGEGHQLTLRTAPAPLPAASATFDGLAEALAGLYAELVLDAAPTGEPRGLLNGAAVRERWAGIRHALRQRYGTGSDVVNSLVAGVEAHLAQPAGLWPSLAYTYWYAALLLPVYAQPWHPAQSYTRPRAFPAFFDGLDLRFTETLRLRPIAPADEAVTLYLTGTPEPATLAAVADHLRQTLGPAAPPAEADAPHLTYEATHRLDRRTGLPLAVELAVGCAWGATYRKEYLLTIEQH